MSGALALFDLDDRGELVPVPTIDWSAGVRSPSGAWTRDTWHGDREWLIRRDVEAIAFGPPGERRAPDSTGRVHVTEVRAASPHEVETLLETGLSRVCVYGPAGMRPVGPFAAPPHVVLGPAQSWLWWGRGSSYVRAVEGHQVYEAAA